MKIWSYFKFILLEEISSTGLWKSLFGLWKVCVKSLNFEVKKPVWTLYIYIIIKSKPAYKCDQICRAKGGGITGWPPDRVSLCFWPFFRDWDRMAVSVTVSVQWKVGRRTGLIVVKRVSTGVVCLHFLALCITPSKGSLINNEKTTCHLIYECCRYITV